MLKQVSVKLPFRVFEELRQEAEKKHLSVSDVMRERIFLKPASKILNSEESNPKISDEKISEPVPYPSTESDFALLEILLLLREFLFERNAQVLKKVDEKLERRFGKDRKRV